MPVPTGDDAVAVAAALLQQAQRLGLLWRMIPGTVVGSGANANNTLVAVDGDPSNPIRTQSLIGELMDDDRVMLIIVPPANNYIIGRYGLESPAATQAQAGVESMTVTAAASATKNVVFPRPYAVAPAVVANINNGAAASSGWIAKCFAITTTGFTIVISGTSSTFTADVYWQSQPLT